MKKVLHLFIFLLHYRCPLFVRFARSSSLVLLSILALLSACEAERGTLLLDSPLSVSLRPSEGSVTIVLVNVPNNADSLRIVYGFNQTASPPNRLQSNATIPLSSCVRDTTRVSCLLSGLREEHYQFEISLLSSDGEEREIPLSGINRADADMGGIFIGVNSDGDEQADSQDADDDNDGIDDTDDNCQFAHNPQQENADNVDDGGDACDPDDDNDGLPDTDDDGANLDNISCRLLPDCDGDTIADNEDTGESRVSGIFCRFLPDCDEDGVNDNEDTGENGMSMIPCRLLPDCDGDTVADTDDNGTSLDNISCYLLPDCDGDGVNDNKDTGENRMSGISCHLLPDCDGDTVTDNEDTGENGTSGISCRLLPDCDEDGVNDDEDTGENGTSGISCRLLPDCDGDTVADTDDDGTSQDNISCRLLPDCDGDGVNDNEDTGENGASMISCRLLPDCDGDGVNDNEDTGENRTSGISCRFLPDCDGDTVADNEDTGENRTSGISCRLLPDCDEDGVNDNEDTGENRMSGISCRLLPDCDGDGVNDNEDTGINVADTLCKLVEDCDEDGIGDGADNCRHQPNSGQEDSDGDGIGDACDGSLDSDADGVSDSADVDDDGNGLVEIGTAEDLNNIRFGLDGRGTATSRGGVVDSSGCPTNGGCRGYELINDINLTSYLSLRPGGWLPIGDADKKFTAILHGNDFTVSGLFIARPSTDYIGLFGFLEQATIRNLRLNAADMSGRNFIGVLAGAAVSVDVSFTTVRAAHIQGVASLGGLIGSAATSRIYASAVQLGSIEGERNLGGLIGNGTVAEISSSYAQAGRVCATGDGAGGLVGAGKDARLVSVYARTESVCGDSFVSGLVGFGEGSRIISSYTQTDNISGNRIYGLAYAGTDSQFAENQLDSYWDNQTNVLLGEGGRETRVLQNLTSYTGIYMSWSDGGDLNGSGAIDDITRWCDRDGSGSIETSEMTTENFLWNLGTADQYPVLACSSDDISMQREGALLATDCGGSATSRARDCALGESRIEVATVQEFDFIGDTDYFNITVLRAGQLNVEVEGGQETFIEIYNGSGLLARKDVSHPAVRLGVMEGDYYIRINGSERGSYRLISSADCGAGVTETYCSIGPSDSRSQAFDSDGDRDAVRLILPEAGRLNLWSVGADTFGSLLTEAGSLLIADNDGGMDKNFNITYSLRAGSYYIRVEGDSPTQRDSYELRTSFVPAMDCGATNEDGCSLGLTDAFLEFMNASDTDVFRVSIDEPGVLSLWLATLEEIAGELRDNDGPISPRAGEDLVYDLAAGNYYFSVSSIEDKTFSYTLASSFFALNEGCGTPEDPCVIEKNDSMEGSVSNVDNSFLYRLNISETGYLTLWTEGDTNTIGALLDNSSRSLGKDDDGGAELNFWLRREIETSGDYFINISAHNIGSYRLLTSFAASPQNRNYYCQDLTLGERSTGTSPDPLLEYQWYLDRTGIKDLWEAGWTGEGVHIAVTDDALEQNHPDLAANVLPNFSRNYLVAADPANFSRNPLPEDCALDMHGTAVVGLIAGVGDNGIGIKGVAPSAGVYFSNVLKGRTRADFNDAFTRHTAETAVSSNSWGPLGATRLRPQHNSERAAMEEELRTGFNGSGILYVFAAGNDRVVDADSVFPSTLENESEDMASYEERLNHRGVIPVCAVHSEDSYASYSNPGVNLWVCAPASDGKTIELKERLPGPDFFRPTPYGITTTDLTGSAGNNEGYAAPAIGETLSFQSLVDGHLNFGGGGFWMGLVDGATTPFSVVHPYTPDLRPGDECLGSGCYLEIYKQPGDSSYHRFFSGTSAAAPIVSGVIALLRGAYPRLTWRDIKLILAESAEQVDESHGTWKTGARAYHDESASYTHSIDYGFGLIDARKAMELAAVWGPLPPEQEYETGEREMQLPVGGELVMEISNATGIDFIEFVQLDINVSSTDFSKLRLTLRSPQGTESLFARPHSCALRDAETGCNDLNQIFTFASAAHLGGNPQGQWTLTLGGIEVATTINAQLRFYGH